MIVTKFSKNVVTWVLFSLFLRNILSHFCDTCPFGKISVKLTRTAEQPQLELFFIAYMSCDLLLNPLTPVTVTLQFPQAARNQQGKGPSCSSAALCSEDASGLHV